MTLVNDLDFQFWDLSPGFPDKNYTKRTKTVTQITIHHSDTVKREDTQRILTNRGLSTHFEVDFDGKVYRYLDPAKCRAYHAGWVNNFTIGIDITHSRKDFPEVQILATIKLVEYLCKKFNIPQVVAKDGVKYSVEKGIPKTIGIVRHRNVCSTDCPVNFPMERLGKVAE